jgi:hypothetical protein
MPLLRNIRLGIENELLVCLQILYPPLFTEHLGELGVIDVAAVSRLVWHVHRTQYAIRLPGDAIGPIAMPANLPTNVVAIYAPYSWSFSSASVPTALR